VKQGQEYLIFNTNDETLRLAQGWVLVSVFHSAN
jgi:hypothetical protein